MFLQNLIRNPFYKKPAKPSTLLLTEVYLIYQILVKSKILTDTTFIDFVTKYYVVEYNIPINNNNKNVILLLFLFKQKTFKVLSVKLRSYTSNFHITGFFNNYENTIIRVNAFLQK